MDKRPCVVWFQFESDPRRVYLASGGGHTFNPENAKHYRGVPAAKGASTRELARFRRLYPFSELARRGYYVVPL